MSKSDSKEAFRLASFYQEGEIEAGCDEAGRGCLAGPVVAAAVILPPDFYHPWLNDSKQLTHKKREALRPIIEKEAIAWSVQFLSAEVIDEINILNASIRGMQLAADDLATKPTHLLIDGNRFHKFHIPHTCFVKGDGRFASIAAASILAKTYRDDWMDAHHEEYPIYEWKKNKGYPTEAHRLAVQQHGLSPYHRKSFTIKKLVQTSLVFDFE